MGCLPDVPVDSGEVVTAAIKIITTRIGTTARILDIKKSNIIRTYAHIKFSPPDLAEQQQQQKIPGKMRWQLTNLLPVVVAIIASISRDLEGEENGGKQQIMRSTSCDDKSTYGRNREGEKYERYNGEEKLHGEQL